VFPHQLGAVAFVCNCVLSALVEIECQLHTSEHMAKSSAISVRVTEETKQAVEKAAEEDGRSVASYVDRLITAHLKDKGYLDK
jgi:predicted HicB family RNase H-like nuclease